MFNFFRRKQATLNSLSIPNFDWELVKHDNHIKQWINPTQTIGLSINFFDQKPDLPTAKGVSVLRRFYRDQIVTQNGGLIEVDFVELKKHQAIRTIFKVPQDPTGMTYLAGLTIPFKKCSYVIKIQAVEVGTTGMRETLITDQLFKEGKITLGENGFEGWFSDPYDPSFDQGIQMNFSEDSTYDSMFPDHPLSQARMLLAQIESEIVFAEDLLKLRTFLSK